MCEGQVTITAVLWKKILKNRAKKITLKSVLKKCTVFSIFLYLGLISGSLITGHVLFKNPIWLLAIWLGCVTFSIHKLYKQIALIDEDMSFYVELNEYGVKIKNSIKLDEAVESTEYEIPWKAYQYYIEHDEYLEIHRTDKSISFLPKNDDINDIIEFTKKYINKF